MDKNRIPEYPAALRGSVQDLICEITQLNCDLPNGLRDADRVIHHAISYFISPFIIEHLASKIASEIMKAPIPASSVRSVFGGAVNDDR